MRTRENASSNQSAPLYLNDDERLLLYHYAYAELHVPEIVEEIAFLSDDERRAILDCVRRLKDVFHHGEGKRRERTAK
jgi:hypothetical protein